MGWVSLTGCDLQEPPPPAVCTDGPTCRGNTLVRCGPDGGVEDTACGDLRCAIDAPVPFCVDPHALPCEPDSAEARCENGLIRVCDADRGYYERQACEDGGICRVDNAGQAVCAPLAEVSCSRTWSPLCVDERLIECDVRKGHLMVADRCNL